MQNSLPCVGLVVLVGSLTFVMAPDEEPLLPKLLPKAGKMTLPQIVIDAGHGGRDEGAKGNGLIEKKLTLDIAQRLEKQLTTFGFPTVMTRSDDSYLGLSERAAIGNRYEDALFVSLHFNHTSSRGVTGVETFYENGKTPPEAAWTWIGFFNKPDTSRCVSGEALAGFVQAALISRVEAKNRGIKPRDLYVVRHVRGPSVLIEGGFLSNAFDAQLLSNPEYRDRLAGALVEGIMTYVKDRAEPTAPKPAPKVGPLVKLDR